MHSRNPGEAASGGLPFLFPVGNRSGAALALIAALVIVVAPRIATAQGGGRPDRIVLVSIDGLAAESATPDRMPELAALLGRAARAERARTGSLHSFVATATMLAGRAAQTSAASTPNRAGSAGLAAALARLGYRGLALPADPFVHARSAPAAGFARLATISPALADSARVDTALTWLASPGRAFVWLGLSFGEAQPAWRREDGFAFADAGARAARAADIDRAVGRLARGLERAGSGTLLALVGTHGLRDDADPWLVPLAFVGPGRTGVIPGETRLEDVAATLVAAAGGSTTGFTGRALLTSRRAAPRPAAAAAEDVSPCRADLAAVAGDRRAIPDSLTLERLRALAGRCSTDARVAIELADAISRAPREAESARLFLNARARWPGDHAGALAYAQHLLRHRRYAMVGGALDPIPGDSPFAGEAAWTRVAALAGELRFEAAARAAQQAATLVVPDAARAAAPRALERLRDTQREVEARASDPAVHLEFGTRLGEYGLMPEAYRHLHRARLADTTRGEPDYRLARFLIGEGRIEPAAATLARALQREPGHRAARVLLAETLIRLDRWREALPHLERAVADDPQDATARYNLACLLARDGRTDEALAALRLAVEAGYSNWDGLSADPDLAPLRDHPGFRALIERRPAPPGRN